MIRTILTQYLKTVGPEILRARWEKAIPGIVVAMRSKGLSPETTSLQILVRDALFRLFRSLIHSGDVSDLLRDLIDTEVVRAVSLTLSADDLLDLTAIVTATMEATLDSIF